MYKKKYVFFQLGVFKYFIFPPVERAIVNVNNIVRSKRPRWHHNNIHEKNTFLP